LNLSSPKLAIARIRLTFAPAPTERSAWLASRKAVYRLVLPKGASATVASLPTPETSTCWSIVANARLELRSATAQPALFERATTPVALAALVVDADRDAIEATEALRIFGAEGAAAIDARMSEIPEPLLPHVASALSSMSCEALIVPMAKLGARAKGPVATRARYQLERCARAAVGEAVKALSEPTAHGLLLGDVLGRTAPDKACDAIVRWPSIAAPSLRRSARMLLSRVAGRCDPNTVAAELSSATADRRTDLLAAFRHRTADLSASLLTTALAAIEGDFDSRWMAMRALGALAAAGEKRAIAALETAATGQLDPHLRALACRGLSEGRGNRNVLLNAARDRDPRVREAAVLSLQRLDGDTAIAMARDPWAFVRQAAAGRIADSTLVGALLGDGVADVRIAAIRAVAERRALPFVPTVVTILRNRQEPSVVRREAAAALAVLCSPDALDGLTEVAVSAARGVESDRDLGVDAIRAIAVLDAARALDLSKRWPARASIAMAAEARDARRTSACRPQENR
jgi:hypothetical protein